MGQQRLGKDIGIGRRVGGRRFLFAGEDVEFAGGMAFVAGIFGGAVTTPLFGDRVDQNRPGQPRLDGAQNAQKLFHVVPVDRAEVGKAQFLEQRAPDGHVFEHVLGAFRPLAERFGQQRDGPFGCSLEFLKRIACIKPGQVAGHCPNRRRNGHFIVVQDDNQPFFQGTGVVHRLIGHACRHRPVTDDRDAIADAGIRRTPQIAGDGETQGGADRGRTMRCAEGVIRRFAAFGETGQPVLHPQGADPVTSPGQDFMGIALVADVPDNLVFRCIKDGMQGDGQFDHAQTRAQMPAGDGNRRDGFSAEFIGKAAQFGV